MKSNSNSVPQHNLGSKDVTLTTEEKFYQYLTFYQSQFKNVDNFISTISPLQRWRFYYDGNRQTHDHSIINEFEETENGYYENTTIAFFNMLNKAKQDPPINICSELFKDFHRQIMKGVGNYTKDDPPGHFNEHNSSLTKGRIVAIRCKRQEKMHSRAWTKDGLVEVVEKIKDGDEQPNIFLVDWPIRSIKLNADTIKDIYGEKSATEITDSIWKDENVDEIMLANLVPGNTGAECRELREKLMDKLFGKYAKKISHADVPFVKFHHIVSLVRECNQSHPFKDGNTRTTCFLLLNFLLVQHNFPLVILNDPNYFDTFSLSQLKDEVIHGMYNAIKLSMRFQNYPEIIPEPLPLADIRFANAIQCEHITDYQNILINLAKLPSYAFNEMIHVFENLVKTEEKFIEGEKEIICVNGRMDTPFFYLKMLLSVANAERHPLAWVAVISQEAKLIQLLAKFKVNLDETCPYGDTALVYAIANKEIEVIQKLIENNVNLNKRNRQGDTPAHHAAKHGLDNVIRMLAEKKADLNIANELGETPACTAAYHGMLSVLYALSEANVDLKKQNKLLEHLKKHYPHPEDFILDISHELNKQIPERMNAIRQLHNFIIEYKEMKESQYCGYKNEISSLDDYVNNLLAVKREFKENIQELIAIEDVTRSEYKAMAEELEKRLNPLPDHQKILSKKIEIIKTDIIKSSHVNDVNFTIFSNVNNTKKKLLALINSVQESVSTVQRKSAL